MKKRTIRKLAAGAALAAVVTAGTLTAAVGAGSSADAARILRYSVGLEAIGDDACDMNGDGCITPYDAALMLRTTPAPALTPTPMAVPTATPHTTHAYGDWVVTQEADCTTDGKRLRICTICGEPETEAIAASGHSWIETTVHHDEVGYWDTPKTKVGNFQVCNVCGEKFTSGDDRILHQLAEDHNGWHHENMYEYGETVWIVEIAAYDETSCTCSVCGTTK